MHMTVMRTVHMSHTRNGMNMHDTNYEKNIFSDIDKNNTVHRAWKLAIFLLGRAVARPG